MLIALVIGNVPNKEDEPPHNMRYSNHTLCTHTVCLRTLGTSRPKRPLSYAPSKFYKMDIKSILEETPAHCRLLGPARMNACVLVLLCYLEVPNVIQAHALGV